MKRVIVSSDLPLVEQLRKEKTQGEREVARLERELELVKGRSEGRIQALEQNLERTNLSLDQHLGELERLTAEKNKLVQELSLLQDSVIDQQGEIAQLRHRQTLIDSELARKDKDAKQLLAAARRYKTRVDYLKSKLRRNRRASKSDEEELGAPSLDNESSSPLNASLLTSSAIGGEKDKTCRKDSIQFPGYMTAEEEYFRLVVMAAKLNISSGTSTPTTADDQPESASVMLDSPPEADEVRHDPEMDPRTMFERAQSEQIPFHKWHEWAQDYVLAHQMPALVGVNFNTYFKGDKSNGRPGFARRVLTGGKKKLKALVNLIPMGLVTSSKKQKSVGIAAGGDGF